MNPEPDAKVEKMPSAIRQIIQRLRWMVAAPVLRPILLQEWTETSDNATRSAKMGGASREWQIEWVARSEILKVSVIEVEQAFGCASFDEQKRYVRHYG